MATTTTKHTCGGPVFGRKDPRCPRCAELLAGAKPIKWRKAPLAQHVAMHDCKARGCLVVCTFGDW